MIDHEAYADSFSRCAVKLTLLFEEQVLAVGSGVIAEHSSGRILITAAHNFTGRDPGTQSPLAKHGGVPNKVKVEGCRASFTEDLYLGNNSPTESAPRYATHPQSLLDVAVLRIKNVGSFVHALEVSFLTPSSNLYIPLYISQTCYIIGFPIGLEHRPEQSVVFPIWKTGHIATEPMSDFEKLPRLLIDATTRRGMSGSMVVVRQREYRGIVGNRLVGVYTGRYRQPRSGTFEQPSADETNDQFTAELGLVTKSDALGQVIAAAPR
jgi:hypothetical protein